MYFTSLIFTIYNSTFVSYGSTFIDLQLFFLGNSLNHINSILTDDACSSTGTGLERTGSLGWTKEASGRDWRMPDRLWRGRIAATSTCRL